MLDVKRLRLLVELSHRGTIAAVAQALSFSPSAVSQQLSVLEKEASARLIEPAGRRVRLTPEGELLVRHASKVLAQLELAQAELAGSRGDAIGTIRVAAFQSALSTLVLPAIRHIEQFNPRCRVEVDEMEPELSVPALVAGDFDIVLAEEYPGHPLPIVHGVDREGLTMDKLELVVPATWSGSRRLFELADRPFAMEPVGTTSRIWATTLCRAAGFEPDVRYTSTDLQMHLRVVEEGLAAALLPERAEAGLHPAVLVFPLPGEPQREVFTVTRAGGRKHPRVGVVVTALQEVCRLATLAS